MDVYVICKVEQDKAKQNAAAGEKKGRRGERRVEEIRGDEEERSVD
jgi:hypothetical protein